MIATPRPSRKHASNITFLSSRVVPSYYYGEGGGPGGWIILFETEIEFGKDILVPDLAGWREERFVLEEDQKPISVVPDWVCEVFSLSTACLDRVKKMAKYADHDESHFCLIDPLLMILEVYRLESGRSMLLGNYAENERVRVEPFQDIEIDLSDLWPKMVK